MTVTLAVLKAARTAPKLDAQGCAALLSELATRMNACRWFTLGVMAPSASEAVASLRQVEAALGWATLELDPACEALATIQGPVFLKGNQNSGRFLVRPENGLGEGLLITGHHPENQNAEDTWGPLPLDLFAP